MCSNLESKKYILDWYSEKYAERLTISDSKNYFEIKKSIKFTATARRFNPTCIHGAWSTGASIWTQGAVRNHFTISGGPC